MSKSKATIIRRAQSVSNPYFPVYLSGFADGEGCFMVSAAPRESLKVRWELRPSFSVSQNGDRAQVLTMMKDYFGCGSIRPDRSDKTLKYEVRSLTDLITKVIPHFERYPLLSAKQASFIGFRDICYAMQQGEHLSPDRIGSLITLASSLNQGKRKYIFGKI